MKSAAPSVLNWSRAGWIATTPALLTAHRRVDRVWGHSNVVRMVLALPNPALAEHVNLDLELRLPAHQALRAHTGRERGGAAALGTGRAYSCVSRVERETQGSLGAALRAGRDVKRTCQAGSSAVHAADAQSFLIAGGNSASVGEPLTYLFREAKMPKLLATILGIGSSVKRCLLTRTADAVFTPIIQQASRNRVKLVVCSRANKGRCW